MLLDEISVHAHSMIVCLNIMSSIFFLCTLKYIPGQTVYLCCEGYWCYDHSSILQALRFLLVMRTAQLVSKVK